MKTCKKGLELLEQLYSGNIAEQCNLRGTKVRFWDTSYRDALPQEIAARKARINESALDCAMSRVGEVDEKSIEEQIE